MPKKSFFENELNNTWREAREKGIEYGIALGHKEGTQGNDRKGMLYVACEMQDLGCMAPSDIDVAAFNRWREYVMSDRNRTKFFIDLPIREISQHTTRSNRFRYASLIRVFSAGRLSLDNAPDNPSSAYSFTISHPILEQ